jgi:hypothetical protein
VSFLVKNGLWKHSYLIDFGRIIWNGFKIECKDNKKIVGKECLRKSVFTPAVTVFGPPEGSSSLRWAKFKIFYCPSLRNIKLCVCVCVCMYEDNCLLQKWGSSWKWRFITTVFWVLTECSLVGGFLSFWVLNYLRRKCEHFLTTTLWCLTILMVKCRSKF